MTPRPGKDHSRRFPLHLVGRARVYFYDLATRQEIAMPALHDLARAGYATDANGVRLDGTVAAVEAVDVATGALRWFTAADFPGRVVAAKFYHPELEPCWLVLRDRIAPMNFDVPPRAWTREDTRRAIAAARRPPNGDLVIGREEEDDFRAA